MTRRHVIATIATAATAALATPAAASARPVCQHTCVMHVTVHGFKKVVTPFDFRRTAQLTIWVYAGRTPVTNGTACGPSCYTFADRGLMVETISRRNRGPVTILLASAKRTNTRIRFTASAPANTEAR